MGRTKVILTLLFMLALGAGLVAGMLIARPPAIRSAPAVARTPLGTELGLTTEQNARMHDIWESVRDKVDACFLRAQEIQERRDGALVALLTPEQKTAFARVQKEHGDALAALKTERDAIFQEAVKRTELILNESQRKRYRQILDNRVSQGVASTPPDWLLPGPPTTIPRSGG